MSDKKPSFQFYPGDWLKDPCAGQCSPQTRGIWVDMFCLMHENNRSGILQGTLESLSQICRCSSGQMQVAVRELKETGTATVTHRNKKITIINRRMNIDYKEREDNKNRQLRHRSKQQDLLSQENNKNITSYSSTSSSTSVFILPNWIPKELWDEWMALRKKKKAINSDRAMNALVKILDTIRKNGFTTEYAITKALEKTWTGIELEWLKNLKNPNNKKTNSEIKPNDNKAIDKLAAELGVKAKTGENYLEFCQRLIGIQRDRAHEN